jgi:hypothetical protein
MNYPSLAATAARLVAQYGKSVTLRRPGAGTFDPVTGQTTPGTPTDSAVKAAEVGYEANERDGTMVRAEDRRFLIAAAGILQPASSDRLLVGSADLAIVTVEPLEPGPTPLLYTVQCRG